MLVDGPQIRLELDSRLTELSRVQSWADALADRCGLTEDARFAMNLCLEEALANVVLHGYQNEPGHPILIESNLSAGSLFFTIEDRAPHFTPVDPGERNGANLALGLESMPVGGNGIRLIHRFAGSVAYEALPGGNRLTIGFPVSAPKNVAV